MGKPTIEQLGGITELDRDGYGTVDANNANLINVSISELSGTDLTLDYSNGIAIKQGFGFGETLIGEYTITNDTDQEFLISATGEVRLQSDSRLKLAGANDASSPAQIDIYAGDNTSSGSGANVTATAGDATEGAGGTISITAGDAGGTASNWAGGSISLFGGDTPSNGPGGSIGLYAGNSTSDVGGSVTLDAGNGGTGTGSINLNTNGTNRLSVSSSNATFNFGGSDVVVGDGFVSVGTTPATAGALRLENNVGIQYRNAADDGNLIVLRAGSSDEVILGEDTNVDNVTVAASSHVNLKAGSASRLYLTSTNGTFNFGSEDVIVGDGFVSVGATPASTGVVRIPSQGFLTSRNAANDDNINLIGVNSGDELVVGDGDNTRVIAIASTDHRLRIGGTDRLLLTDTETTFNFGGSDVVVGDGFVSVPSGSNVASAGGVRLGNNLPVMGRNAANTDNVEIARVNASNELLVGYASGIGTVNTKYYSAGAHFFMQGGSSLARIGNTYLSIGTTPATSGAVRLGNNVSIQFRNSTDSEDVQALAVDSNNDLVIGASSGLDDVIYLAVDTHDVRVNGTSVLTIAGSAATFNYGGSDVSVGSGYIAIGSDPATLGNVRLENNSYVAGRNAANDDNVVMLELTSGDVVRVGDADFATRVDGSSVNLQVASTDRVYVTATQTIFDYGGSDVSVGNGYVAVRNGSSVASAGGVRLGNEHSVMIRNAADTNNVEVVRVNASDELLVGYATGVAPSNVKYYTAGTHTFFNDTTEVAEIGDTYLSIGNVPASTGAIRIENDNSIKARNNADGDDIDIVKVNTSDEVEIGDTTTAAVAAAASDRFKVFKTLELSEVTALSGSPATGKWWLYAASDGLHAVSPSGTDTVIAPV